VEKRSTDKKNLLSELAELSERVASLGRML